MRKATTLLTAILLIAIFASCGDKNKELAEDFVKVINQKDTVKLGKVIVPRTAQWAGVDFATVNPDNLKVEETADKKCKVETGNGSYFVMTVDNEGGYKITKVKGLLLADKALVAQAVEKGYLGKDYDDIDAIAAVAKLKAEQAATAAKEAAQKAMDAKVEQKLKQLYAKYVYGNANFSGAANSFCTKKMQKKLIAACPYDEGCGSFFMTELIGGAQDWDTTDRLKAVTSLGDGWYKVTYTVFGGSSTIKVKAVEENGDILFDDYK